MNTGLFSVLMTNKGEKLCVVNAPPNLQSLQSAVLFSFYPKSEDSCGLLFSGSL